MLKTIALLVAVASAAFAEDPEKDQTQVWHLEKAHRECVWVSLATVGSYSGT